VDRLDRLPAASQGRTARLLWLVALTALAVGLGGWAYAGLSDSLQAGIIALWAFTAAAAAFALVLPLPRALVSPLFMGVVGWLVDMLPFVMLVGWGVVALRWGWSLWAERRLPRGGRWTWIPLALIFWTAAGVLVITSADFKHFLLLLGIQVLASAAILAVVDMLTDVEGRIQVVEGMVAFVVVLSVGVFLQWVGVPLDPLQDNNVRRRAEVAYGVDAFPNNIGMIKYARSIKAGVLEAQGRMEELADSEADLPGYKVFRPKFQAYANSLVVRFEGSARPFEEDLEAKGVTLLYDNIGLAEANTVPRLRSFPRNALTYAGVCAALIPLAFFLVWTGARRRRLLGWAGVVACFFGAGFSLARGSWVAIAIGLVYLAVDGVVERRLKLQFLAAYLIAALVLTGVFLVKYGVDPLNGRAGGGASVNTRDDLYKDTLSILKGNPAYIALGYGTEKPRTETGTVKEGTRYVPRAGTHSTYLNYLFRTGVIGALLLMALYVLAALRARAGARLVDGIERVLSSNLATSMVIVMAHGVILSLYVEPIYTLVVSLIVGLASAARRPAEVPA
jgi:hypothetical protein